MPGLVRLPIRKPPREHLSRRLARQYHRGAFAGFLLLGSGKVPWRTLAEGGGKDVPALDRPLPGSGQPTAPARDATRAFLHHAARIRPPAEPGNHDAVLLVANAIRHTRDARVAKGCRVDLPLLPLVLQSGKGAFGKAGWAARGGLTSVLVRPWRSGFRAGQARSALLGSLPVRAAVWSYVGGHTAVTRTALRVPCPGRPGAGAVAIARTVRAGEDAPYAACGAYGVYDRHVQGRPDARAPR